MESSRYTSTWDRAWGSSHCTIDELFRPNNKDDIAREDPISLKKLRKGDAAWSTQKFVLGWAIDTVKQVLTLPADRKTNILAMLDTIPAHCQPMLPTTLSQTTRKPT